MPWSWGSQTSAKHNILWDCCGALFEASLTTWFWYAQTCEGFINHNLWICVINCPQEEVELWLKVSSYFWTINCHERCERQHRACRHQCLGSDTANHQHFKTILWKRGCHCLVLHPFRQIHESHLWRLRRWVVPQRVQRSDGRAEKRKIFSSRLCCAPPFRNQNFQLIYT